MSQTISCGGHYRRGSRSRRPQSIACILGIMAAIAILLARTIALANIALRSIATTDLLASREALLLVILAADPQLPARGVARAVMLWPPRATTHQGTSTWRCQRQCLQLTHGLAAGPLEHLPSILLSILYFEQVVAVDDVRVVEHVVDVPTDADRVQMQPWYACNHP